MNNYIIHIATTNDTNGNPRRAYVLYRNGAVLAVYNEGYHGYMAVPEQYRDMAQAAPTIQTTPAFYHEMKTWGHKNNPA